MPRQASADWNAADRAPEYPPGAGEQVSTTNHPATETRTEMPAACTLSGSPETSGCHQESSPPFASTR